MNSRAYYAVVKRISIQRGISLQEARAWFARRAAETRASRKASKKQAEPQQFFLFEKISENKQQDIQSTDLPKKNTYWWNADDDKEINQ